MTELDSWSRDLILAAKGVDDPSAEQRARLRASILAATAGAGVAIGGATAAASTTTKTALWLKLLFGAVSIGAISGVSYGVWTATVTAPSGVTAPTAQVVAARPGAAMSVPRTERASAEPAATGAPALADTKGTGGTSAEAVKADGPAARSANALPAKGAPKPGLAEEVALIARARSAVQSGSAAEAQNLLARHRKMFPRGSLGLERSGLEIILACRSGGGTSQATAFLKRFGRTPIAGSVRSACGISE